MSTINVWTDADKNDEATGCLYGILTLLLLPLVMYAETWALNGCWNCGIAPMFSLPMISWWVAFGINSGFGLLKLRADFSGERDRLTPIDTYKALLSYYFTVFIQVCFVAIAHLATYHAWRII